MSLQAWQKNGWLRPHESSPAEVAGLLAVIARDLKTSGDKQLDADWRFAIAYTAALQCAAVCLHAAGFEVPKGGGAHQRTIESLRLTLGDDGTIVDMLQAFRAKRGGGIYETTGVASRGEIEELHALAGRLQSRVREWLATHHPEFAGPGAKAGKRKPAKGLDE